MPRNPRLALPQHLCQLADGQLHDPEQRKDAQPRRIGQRLESVGKRQKQGHADKDIKISLYGQFGDWK
jgi:hypothetical protein